MPTTSAARTLASDTDEILFTLYARTGDEQAIGTIVERWQPRLINFFLKRLKNESRAEDLSQDTLRRIIGARKSYDNQRAFSTWIYTIASNLLKNEYRNTQRRRESNFTDLQGNRNSKSDDRPLELVTDHFTPEDAMLLGERQRAVQEILADLEDNFREPMRMRFLDDATYEEIAAACDIKVGTVKSRLNRGRAQFRTMYLERYGSLAPR